MKLLKGIDPYELTKLAETLKPIKFAAGEYVCREGAEGDVMYLVQDGSLVAIKKINDKPK